MRQDGVAVAAPCFNDGAAVSPGAEPLHRQAFVAQLAVEPLVGAVLPRLTRFDVGRVNAGVGDPLQYGARDKLGTTVRANNLRCAMLVDQSAEHFDDPRRANGAGHIDSQAFPGVLIDDRKRSTKHIL